MVYSYELCALTEFVVALTSFKFIHNDWLPSRALCSYRIVGCLYELCVHTSYKMVVCPCMLCFHMEWLVALACFVLIRNGVHLLMSPLDIAQGIDYHEQ
ncbi:uncharacterized protein G2W53_001579 [Senna tora]|uniref:Uncharacterized protein n=1 Tax=Senna tora TaxID=362788 RepID=A0A834XG67_9FABA|nr:uncharacterized protein G2W53_001579 [Senna tora]